VSTVRYYRHDDAGAPLLTGQVGSLTALLRACLVGNNGVAYGSKPSAGWSEVFAGVNANIAVFRNSQAAGGSGCHVRIDDSGVLASGAREASVRAYAAMTDINTGEALIGDVFFRKSAAVSTVARSWLVVADQRTFWLYSWAIGDSGTQGQGKSLLCAGDYDCVVDSVPYRYMLAGRSAVNDAVGLHGFLRADGGVATINSNSLRIPPLTGMGAGLVGRLVQANYLDVQPSAAGTSYYGAGPHPVSGKYHLVDRPVVAVGNTPYGTVRGLALPLVRLNHLAPGTMIPGSDRYCVVQGDVSSNGGENTHFGVAIDTQGPWA